MLSKSQIKLITRLKQKKYRIADGFFVAEGLKVIQELLESTLELEYLFTTVPFKNSIKNETLITEHELKKISFLTTPNKALAVFKIPEENAINNKGLIVALDSVRDPGNLGTIIRMCDWFGIKELVCSKETVDCYNPKVVQATMGSLTRVNINYLDLNLFLAKVKTPILGAFMDGENVYKSKLPNAGVLIMGNEANGISQAIEKQITQRIAIPRFGDLQVTESLNVATATAILLSEFRRN